MFSLIRLFLTRSAVKTRPLDRVGGLGLETLESRLTPSAVTENQVVNLFRAFLDRIPESSGLVAWSSALESGRLSVGQMADRILQSPEYAGRSVTAWYEEYLNRAPENAGLASHVAALLRGVPSDRVEASIVGSEESFDRHGSNNIQFVEGLYETEVLGRPADPTGLEGFVALLDRGTSRTAVAYAFLSSPEYGCQVAGEAYQEVLGRVGTSVELGAWARVYSQSRNGTRAVLTGVADSPEGKERLSAPDLVPFKGNRATGLNFASALEVPEQRVLESLSRGLTMSEISSVLGIKEPALDQVVASLKDKLHATTIKQVIANAQENGLVKPPSAWVRGATLPPHNPYTGPAGTSTMHANSASSDATLNPGPGIGGYYNVVSTNYWNGVELDTQNFSYALPTILMPQNGGLVCVGVGNDLTNKQIPTVLLVSPFSLEILDSYELTKPQSGNLAGGVYSYLDHNNDLVLVNGDGYLQWYNVDYNMATDSGTITLEKEVNINQPMTVALVPDYQGNIWFATQGGIEASQQVFVGFYDPKSQESVTFALPFSEMVANSISSSPAGIAVATTQALYMFNSKANVIQQEWRYEYENSGYRKPGQLSPGTGATPVFFGPKTGFEYIAITDNGATDDGNTPAENFNIYLTRKAGEKESQLIATVPFLTDLNSGTENAPIAVGSSVFSPSSYGYWYPPPAETPSTSVPSTFNAASFPGGAQRIDLVKGNSLEGQSWQSTWQNQSAKSAALPRLSLADEQIYTVLGSYNNAGLFSGSGVQYYFGAIDPKTGVSTNLQPLGVDTWDGDTPAYKDLSNYNNNPLEMTGVISPEGVFYQGMASGIFSIEGPRARYGIGITNDGYAFTNRVSFDGDGNTYSSQAIGDAMQDGILMWNGVEFQLGSPNGLSFQWANGQEIQVEQGNNFNTLNLAAAAIGGEFIIVELTIYFTDGTTAKWIQEFSDWCNPNYNLGEAIISHQDYRNTSAGGTNSTANNIYGYSYSVPAGKTVESISLPFEPKLRLLGLTMSSSVQVDIGSFVDTMGIGTAPYQLPNSQGMDGKGQYYSSSEINQFGTSGSIGIAWAGANFNIGPVPTDGKSPSSSNVVESRGQTIPLPSGDFNWLYLIGASGNGTQENQSLYVNYSNGLQQSVSQTFTDWNNSGNPIGIGSVENETVLSWTGQLNQDGNQNGTSGNNAAFVYGYAISLNGSDPESLILPNNENIKILGISLI